MRKLSHLLSVIFLFISTSYPAYAQDPHFSQYFASPLTLNPATTGFFDGDYRIAGNQRQQWWNVGPGYSTTSISADFKIARDRLEEFDTFALGLSGLFDKSLNGALQSNYIGISGAYHKSLADNGSQVLGVGFQVTFANRHLDYSKLTFATQYNNGSFDPTIAVNLDNSNVATNYIDVNAGILYQLHFGKSNLYAGASLYHTNQPVSSLFNVIDSKIPILGAVQGGGEFYFDQQSSILFSGVYMRQADFRDRLAGFAYGLNTTPKYSEAPLVKIYLGFWYRVDDAYIPYIGIDYDNLSVGVNYSLPQSTITSYSSRTFEISLIYRHKYKNNINRCPRF